MNPTVFCIPKNAYNGKLLVKICVLFRPILPYASSVVWTMAVYLIFVLSTIACCVICDIAVQFGVLRLSQNADGPGPSAVFSPCFARMVPLNAAFPCWCTANLKYLFFLTSFDKQEQVQRLSFRPETSKFKGKIIYTHIRYAYHYMF